MNRPIPSLVAVLVLIFLLSAWVPQTIATEDSWTTLEPMPTARSGIGVAIVDGIIYAIGGSYDSFGENEAYDPATNTWTTKTPMPTPRINFGIAVVENKIYTIGGDSGNWSSGSTPSNIVEVYDPLTDTWETKCSMNIRRIGLSASVVDGKIFVMGGRTGEAVYEVAATEVYDPATDTWSTANQIPTPVTNYVSAVVNHKIYIIGGAVGLSLTQIYDAETDTWSTGASMPTGVDSAAAGVITDTEGKQKIYVIGGKQNLDAVNLTQIYDPETDTWSTGTSMPTARYGLDVATVNNMLYAVGGREGWFGSPISAANEQYIPIEYENVQPTATSSFSPNFVSTFAASDLIVVIVGAVIIVAIIIVASKKWVKHAK